MSGQQGLTFSYLNMSKACAVAIRVSVAAVTTASVATLLGVNLEPINLIAIGAVGVAIGLFFSVWWWKQEVSM